MLCLTKMVGDNCAVVDTDDGVVEWRFLGELDSLGVDILGLRERECRAVELSPSDMRSVFTKNAAISMRLGGKFIIRSNGRQYKGRVVVNAQNEDALMEFNSGVFVRLNFVDGLKLLSGDPVEAYEALAALSEEAMKN